MLVGIAFLIWAVLQSVFEFTGLVSAGIVGIGCIVVAIVARWQNWTL